MIPNLRRLLVVGGGAGALTISLLAIAAVTDSWILALLAGVLGIGLIVMIGASVFRVAARSSALTRQLSTKANNLEARERVLAERVQLREDGEIVLLRRVVKLEEIAVGNAKSFDAMREFREQTVAEFDRTERALFARISSIENELALLSNSAASFVKAVKNLNSMQTQTKDLVERNNRDIRVLRKRVTSEFKQRVESDLNDLKLLSREMLRATFEVSLILGQNPPDVISMDVAKRLLDDYITSGDIVRTQPLLEYFDLQDDLSVTDLRTIYRGLRAAGYWGQALKVLRVVARKSRRENDVRAIAKIEHEISAYSCNDRDVPDFPEGSCYDPEGPILHMVGRVLPDTQTGYTLRTHYTATAQARKGLPVAIVGQPGITDRNLKETERYTHQGIDYYLLPGPSRKEALLDEWLVSAVKNVALLVQQLRPSILHAQSDFFNALIAQMVGKEYGIPTVYESRGFWEESWLSRTITAQGWGANAEEIFQKYSLPDAYILRKRAEEIVRQRADHVFTLAEVMQNHILESADGAIEPQQSLLSRTP